VCRVNEDEGLEKGNVGRGKERSVVSEKSNSSQQTPSEHQQVPERKTAYILIPMAIPDDTKTLTNIINEHYARHAWITAICCCLTFECFHMDIHSPSLHLILFSSSLSLCLLDPWPAMDSVKTHPALT
jgi:hypothetical protein